MSYHIILRVLIIGFVICTTIFYLSFHKSLMAIEHNISDADNSIKEKIDSWLEQRPFPLSEADLTMEKTAESIGISTSSLSYYIYEFAGKTFLSWQSECRMKYCKELLEDERKNISEIAYECGVKPLKNALGLRQPFIGGRSLSHQRHQQTHKIQRQGTI